MTVSKNLQIPCSRMLNKTNPCFSLSCHRRLEQQVAHGMILLARDIQAIFTQRCVTHGHQSFPPILSLRHTNGRKADRRPIHGLLQRLSGLHDGEPSVAIQSPQHGGPGWHCRPRLCPFWLRRRGAARKLSANLLSFRSLLRASYRDRARRPG